MKTKKINMYGKFCLFLIISMTLSISGCKQNTTSKKETTSSLNIDVFSIPGVGEVSTVFIEDKNGIVLIDAQRTKSAGKQVVDMIKSKNKELYAVIITHPHPDHVGGLPTILESYPNTPILGTKATSEEMRTDSEGEFYFARKVNGDEYPTELALPTRFITDGETVEYGDVKLIVQELGAGEAIDMNVFYSEELNSLFVGDLMDNNRLGFVLEKRTTAWLEQLDEVMEKYKERNPMAYPGHGDPERLEILVEEQKKWLKDLRNLVLEKMGGDSTLTDVQVDEIEMAFEELHPNQIPVAPIPDMMKLNIKAVAEELLKENDIKMSKN